ncbi:MAG: hypothetical protein M1814_000955 [Vezdaea aestivalis]|nr:MAG: hypothetical protein M1814_000955 [Vezdaea aestivalis]
MEPEPEASAVPLWIHKPTEPHRRTVIVLHGRGDSGPDFAPLFLQYSGSGFSSKTEGPDGLVDRFPNTKFICPTADLRPAAALRGTPIHQWFEISSLAEPARSEENQIEGLRESVSMLHKLIREESDILQDSKKVFLGGLSQGCAVSIHAILTLDEPIGGFFGMSGWFPFVAHLENILGLEAPTEESLKDPDVDNINAMCQPPVLSKSIRTTYEPGYPNSVRLFAPKANVTAEKKLEALAFLRNTLQLPGPTDSSLSVLSTPVWIGHGAIDRQIKCHLSFQIQQALGRIGMKAELKIYDDLDHWYKVPEEIGDIVDFLKSHS